jgi:hypothetical protein
MHIFVQNVNEHLTAHICEAGTDGPAQPVITNLPRGTRPQALFDSFILVLNVVLNF